LRQLGNLNYMILGNHCPTLKGKIMAHKNKNKAINV
jgi:hypothetical protein